MDSSTVMNIWLLCGPSLVLGALSGYMSERVGVVNIGINGMMIFGAFFFCLFSNLFPGSSSSLANWFLPTMVLAAICTIIVGAFFAFATVKLKSNHVIVGTAINLFASGVGLTVAEFAPSFFGITNIKNQFNQTWLFEGNGIYGSNLLAFIFAILIVAGIYVIMNFTKIGLRYKACGENPNAIDNQGINVNRYQFLGLLMSSFIAGLGGAYYAYNSVAFSGEVSGYGFISLAIMIVGAWKILPISVIGLIFSFIMAYVRADIAFKNPYLLRTVPYILAIATTAIFGRWAKPPAHVGIPFDKSSR